ncbi:hypothetical protein Moror_2896 [Moniliophthora roreri MCA 2997]|uniref:F-box domain-containing protein n=2 Tax=Moniliophthora roreri TaxID=221103 RepID=V2XC28_MONRO|nr:hypothetical protein Moror_2896 [Moniliophthora roreri MCA 2997]
MAPAPCTTRILSTVLCDKCENTFVGRAPHPTPTSDKFRSGTLSEVEISQALLLLQEDEMELKRYDEELATLGKAIRKLKSERTSLLESVARRRSLVSPMRRIPLEIWDLIFSEAVASWPGPSRTISSPRYSLYVHYDHGDTETLPRSGEVFAPSMILSHVSSQWRTMLFSMPHLWSSISVDIYGLTTDISSIMKMFFKKSARYPLTIEIKDSGWEAHPDLDLKLKMMEEWGYDLESVGDCFWGLDGTNGPVSSSSS